MKEGEKLPRRKVESGLQRVEAAGRESPADGVEEESRVVREHFRERLREAPPAGFLTCDRGSQQGGRHERRPFT